MTAYRMLACMALVVAFVPNAWGESSNQGDVRTSLEEDGWRGNVAYGRMITEREYVEATGWIVASVYLKDPQPFLDYISAFVDSNIDKISAQLPGIGRDDLIRWLDQSVRQNQIITYQNLQVNAGFATYNRWQDVSYPEPRTGQRRVNGPFGTWTYVPYVYYENVTRRTPLPNWHQFYVRFRFIGGPSPSNPPPSPTNATQRFCRFLEVINRTGEPIDVDLQYLTWRNGGWNWIPTPPGPTSQWTTYSFSLGADTFLGDQFGPMQRVTAVMIRIRAKGRVTGKEWLRDWNQDFRLAPPEGYFAAEDQVFKYSFD